MSYRGSTPNLYERLRQGDDRYLDDGSGGGGAQRNVRARWSKPRVAVAVAAVSVTVIMGIWATTGNRGGITFVVLPVSVAFVVVTVLTRRTELLPWGAAGMAVVYMLERADGDPDVGAVALFAVALLVVLELVFTACDLGTGVAWERPAVLRRWLMLIGLVVVAVSAAVVVAVVGSAGRLSGGVLFGFGAAGAVAALISVVRFVRGSVR